MARTVSRDHAARIVDAARRRRPARLRGSAARRRSGRARPRRRKPRTVGIGSAAPRPDGETAATDSHQQDPGPGGTERRAAALRRSSRAGRVAINGEVRREPGAQADPERDVDHRRRATAAADRPRIATCSCTSRAATSRAVRDPEGRPVVDRPRALGHRAAVPGRSTRLRRRGPAPAHQRRRARQPAPPSALRDPAGLRGAQVERRVRAEDLPRWRRGVVLPDGPAVPRAVRTHRAREARARRGSRSRSPRGAIAR